MATKLAESQKLSETFASNDYSAANYAKHRPKYPPQLFEAILNAHDATPGAKRELVVDIGCGPATATAPLVGQFERVVGVDPGEGMLAQAKVEAPGAEFHVGSADSMPFVKDNSVDLIVSGTAAHWFPADWWKEADRILKPVGTVAIFEYGQPSPPSASPEQARHFAELHDRFRARFNMDQEAQAQLAHGMYEDLPLPGPHSPIKLVRRQYWNRDGLVDDTEEGGRGRFVLTRKVTAAQFRMLASTASPVHRWRKENPTLVGTAQDPLEALLNEFRTRSGVDDDTPFELGHPVVLLLFSKQT